MPRRVGVMRSVGNVAIGVTPQWGSDQEFVDIGQVLFEADPPHHLSDRWHNHQPEHQELFGRSDARFAELMGEPQSNLTFAIEPMDPYVMLPLTPDDFVPDSEMCRGTRDGWPAILSNLKTLLATGTTMKVE